MSQRVWKVAENSWELETSAAENSWGVKDTPEKQQSPAPPVKRITVNKRTHRVKFENETESEVTIVIEEKEGAKK